jgi:hypothetical protein
MNTPRIFGFVAALSGLFFAVPANAAIVALYDFPTGSTTLPSASSDSDAASNAGALSMGSGFTSAGISTSSGNPANSLFVRPADNSTEVNAFSGNRYFTFSVTPVSGTLSFASLAFDYRRDQIEAAANFALYASTTGSFTAGANLLTGTLSNVSTTTFSNLSLNLSGISSLQNVSSTTTFRLYLWGANGSTIPTRFDNITLSTAAVPEPGTWALLAGGLGLLGVLRFQSRAKAGRS